MKRTLLVILIDAGLVFGLAMPGFGRVEPYGHSRFNRVGHGGRHGGGHIVDRGHGPGWGGVALAGILGAAAGAALGANYGPRPVVVEPPALYSMVPGLPVGCVTVPTYTGGVLYNCGNIYYQPVYEGTSLMYQIVPAP